MIEYKGVQYPIREVKLGDRYVSVAPIELGDQIIVDGVYTDKEGQYIDEQIYYYCYEEEWKLSDEELIELLKETL